MFLATNSPKLATNPSKFNSISPQCQHITSKSTQLALNSPPLQQNNKFLLRDITACLHLARIVSDFTQITKKHRQFVPNCSESPRNTAKRLKMSCFAGNQLQLPTNRPSSPSNAKISSETSMSASILPAWSLIQLKSSPNVLYSSPYCL